MRISKSFSVPANATTANLLAGELAEQLTAPSAVRLAAVAAAAGVFATFLVGRETVLDDQELSNANRFPVFPDDVVGEHGGFPLDKLTLRLRNSTGAAIVTKYVVDVEDL